MCVWLMVQGECRKKAQVRELEVEIGEVVIWGIPHKKYAAACSKGAGTINITRTTLSCDALIRSAGQEDWSRQDLPLIIKYMTKISLGMKLVSIHPDHKYLCESVMCWLHVAEIHTCPPSCVWPIIYRAVFKITRRNFEGKQGRM